MNVNKSPIEVATNMGDLMRFEYMVRGGALLPNRPIYSLLAGRHAAKMRGRGLDFEEVRLYVSGDDIRNIDWKVTARNIDTYSKVFNEEKERPTFMLLDQSASMFFGSVLYVKSVTAAHVAALAAFHTIKRGDRFGGLIFGDDSYDYLSPKRNKSQVERFMQLVVERNNALTERKTIKPCSELFNEMIRRAQSLITHDYVLTVITSLQNLDEDSRHILKTLSFNNEVIVVHVEDPMDKYLPEGQLVLTDGDRQITWNNGKNKWGEKYADAYQRNLKAMIEEFRTYRIPVSVMSTATSVETQIKERIGQRLKP